MACDVSGDHQAAHGMADQGDARVLAESVVVPVVLGQERPVDDFLDERGQLVLDPMQGQPPVIAEREDRHGSRLTLGESVAQLFDEVLVD